MALVILGFSLFVLSGCGSSPGTGTVNGVFETIGHGPGYGPHLHGLSGTVLFTNGQGARTTVRVSSNGTFSVELEPGTYSALGHSPQVHSGGQEMACNSIKPVVVESGISVSVTVACQLR